MQLCGVGPAIPCRNADQYVLDRNFGVLDENIEVAVLVEYSRIHQLEFGVVARTVRILFDQLFIRKLRLRIFVEVFQIRARRRRIEVKIILLHVLAMIALQVGEPEETFLQNWIALIPECHGEADALVPVAKTRDAIFTPAVGARTGVIMRKIIPGIAVRAVILADSSPLALGEIRSPALPMGLSLVRFL